ncbi:hypothetical protein GCM10022600_02490 [Qipengyuania pelagi]
MHHERHQQHPPGAKDQKQLDRDHGVDDEEAVGHPRKHLRPRERSEQRIATYLLSHDGATTLPSGVGGRFKETGAITSEGRAQMGPNAMFSDASRPSYVRLCGGGDTSNFERNYRIIKVGGLDAVTQHMVRAV